MAYSIESEDQSNQYEKMQADILAKLEERRQQFPNHFTKPIHVLAAVNANVNGQWEQRLQQAKENQTGERIILIPYNVRDCHWIGVLIKFTANEQIERADFIDPVKQSNFTPQEIQKPFARIYSYVILQSTNFPKHDDPKQSASLTIENLVKAAQEAQSMNAKHIDSVCSPSQTPDDHNVTRPESTVNQGNHSELNNSKRTSDNDLDSLENQDAVHPPVKLPRTEQPIEPFQKKKVEELTNANESVQPKLESYEVLKEKLKNGLLENDINDKTELQERIIEKKQLVECLKKTGKHNLAQKRQNSLTNLEELQQLADRMKDIESGQATADYKALKRQLEEGLAEQDISNEEELKRQIIEKKRSIESLEKEGKHNLALKRQKSLTNLQQLQQLADRIKAAESPHMNDDYEVLKKQLEDGLTEQDIANREELKQRIGDKKEEIQSLAIEEKHKLVRQRQNSLSKLQELKSLVDKIEVIESQHPNLVHRESEQQLNVDQPVEQQPELAQVKEIVNTNTSIQEDCLLSEESLKHMYQDFCSMPSCSEKHIISLLFYVSLKLAGNTMILDDTIKIPNQIETEMIKELECLKKRLKIEELLSVGTENLVEKCFINLKDENWKAALILLRSMLKQISPLDMRELLRLIEKVDDAAHLIKDKDIILFLGGTGSGKSTTIHFLSGSKMVETEVKGLNHIAATKIKNADLNKITIAPFARSETRYITPVTVNFGDVGGCNNGSTVLCDSPGFEDTNGPEVDIANGIGIIKAIKGCKSVKPVLLISYRSIGDRCDGVKGLAYMLVGLIPGIKDHIKTFSYIFTKFPPKEHKRIHAILSDVNTQLNEEEKSNISFTIFLKDMLQKTIRGARVLDPVVDTPGQLLDELAESAVILYPEEVFQFSITEKSRAIVQEQVRKNQLSIMSATKRSDYPFLKYKLDQLKCLNDLLHRDYIEHIYTDCTRFISKHLFEEYQEGISSINRCLINQTILNIEDIQYYQTCMEHAKQAEESVNSHLGNEVIHSSAFIQYLNQQVDLMRVELEKKDIDDTSVKISLDKIKLLSNFFSDANNTYKNICQLFSEKVQSVVNAFKNSVSTNEFDQSAVEIRKLHEGLTVLQDHLGHEDLPRKYKELREFFLKYLNDSIGKLNRIFSQEKLEKTDIDSLNSCVCMLESVMNTYTLQPHISKEIVNEIHKEFLSKILNYFEMIVNKIQTEFKNTNAFHTLERYMIELDLIRTISTIELKTNQSYSKILETLVVYIHESRRDAEELLRVLFRREGKVSYDKLIKCLNNLESAKWIENYRVGVHSDVINNVKEQIFEHIKTLGESLQEFSLDLDNFDKIEYMAKILSEINEMKHFEEIVMGVTEQITTVNSWFEERLNCVFVIIKELYSTEKFKEQGYETVDFNKVEKALRYLDACKKIRLSCKNDCTLILNGLEEFVRSFSNFVQKEMTTCFGNIKQFDKENKEEIFNKARSLAVHLQEISEIKAKYSRAFSCFSNQKIVEEWQNELASYLAELSDEMGKLSVTQQTKPLSIKLLLAKALSKLDSFIEGEKYNSVYLKYQNMFFSQTNDVCRQVIDAIGKTDYERVASDMLTLQSSSEVGEHFFKQAKRALNIGLDDLIEETKAQAIMLGNNIEIQQINSIVEKLKRIQKAKQFISQHLDKPDEIEKCTTEVKKLVEERIERFLEGVTALITINNFYEADKKIDSITLVRTLLGNYCTEHVSKQIEQLKDRQNKVVLQDVVAKYSKMDISSYTLNPPTDIFAKFGEVNNTNPIYNQALNTIKENILAKFRKELDDAKSKRPPNPENLHIRKFESAVKYLPEGMRNALETELKHCKSDISTLIRDNDTELENALQSGDLKSIKSVLEKYEQTADMQSYLTKGRETVLKQMREIASVIIQHFEKHEIIEALDNVKKLYEYKVELEKVVVDIKQPYSEVRSRIKSTFQEAYLCFRNRFLKNTMSDVSNETIEVVEKSFICLIEFMKFRDEFKGQSILAYMFPENFNEKIVDLNRSISNYATERQKKYQLALDRLDITSLKDSLDSVNQWNSLLIKMKAYDNMHNINDTAVNTFVKDIVELTSYSQMLETVTNKIQELKDELINQALINNDTKAFCSKRDEFYRRLNEKFCVLNKAKVLSTFSMTIDLNAIEQQCLESLQSKVNEVYFISEKILQKFLQDSKLTRQEYDNFNMHYSNLVSFREEMKVTRCGINEKIAKIDEKFFQKIHLWETSAEQNPTIENVAGNLIKMKRVSNNIPSFQIRMNDRIDEVINIYKTTLKDSAAFGKLGTVLNQEQTGIGQSIISEHKAFQGYSLFLFNEKTRKHGVDYVLNNLDGDSIDRSQLKKRYENFVSIYDELIKQHLKSKIELDKLISDTKLIAGHVKQQTNNIEWDATVRNKVPQLAAHIFALWTLKNADHYFEADGVDNYLLQPHAAQIISIFRMLGIGDKEEKLKNNLVQIGTGEGKSITLAATAAILVLLGFDVYCVCYSEYLSQRDYKKFQSLFDSLGLLDYIHYGTFNKLCEDMINENGDIRQIVQQLISKDSRNTPQNSQHIKRAKTLLIDEVDVFFSREFYGNVYTPSATLRDPTITALVNFTWAHRKSKINLNKMKATVEYQNCYKRYPNWKLLIQEAVKDMLSDVNNFESHNYVVKTDKIGYIEQDNIVYNVVYGYKTLFAYHFEHEKGKISKESLDENICMKIKCGSFSYAEIPLQFRYIMGVTGTLETLSPPEKRIIQNVYKITKSTFIPSVFGKNNLKFIEKDDIMIENGDDYFNEIRREIDNRLVGRSEKRAVLVLFESKKKLLDFYNSDALIQIKDSVVYLTEEASLEEKENLIRRATLSGQVTLLTRTFGRGTDFICYDKTVATNGGTHVIQTFLSEEFSEEVQIRGRAARQGDPGSYSLVLLDRDLEKFNIEGVHIEDVKKGRKLLNRIVNTVSDVIKQTNTYETIYDLLHDKRTDLFKTQYDTNIRYVEQAKERHLIAAKFLVSLNAGDINSVKEFLVEENKGAEGNWSSRTIILMDATSSMTHLLHKCKSTVDIMFERASQILKANKISSDSFQIQFVVYRNYDSHEDKILQSSPWETKPDNLRAFMHTIDVEGGWGNEAIEIGLWHANKENENEIITQVILIGDAPPNNRNEVDERRQRRGENYWTTTKFSQPTYFEDELAKLVLHGIPVHAFFVKQLAEEAFKKIASRTGGRCEMLDINSLSGSEILTNLVTEEILRNIGGSSKGNALVEAYRSKFGRSYT